MKKVRCLRRSYMTLLETLIAFMLLSILLVFVFDIFRELTGVSRLSEKAQKESFQMRYLETRLGYLFERVVNENEGTKRSFFFYTEPSTGSRSDFPSLVLTFDNEVRADPKYSGDVLGKIYVDGENRLCLAVWPLGVEDPYQYFQEEVLIDNVGKIAYEFYSPPERKKNAKDIAFPDKVDPEKKYPPKDDWLPEWFFTYEQMPSIIKIKITFLPDEKGQEKSANHGKKNEKEFTLEFVLPSSVNYIYYPPGEFIE